MWKRNGFDADDFFVSLPTKQEEPSGVSLYCHDGENIHICHLADLLARRKSIAKWKRATLNTNRRDAVMVKLLCTTVNTAFLLSVPLSKCTRVSNGLSTNVNNRMH